MVKRSVLRSAWAGLGRLSLLLVVGLALAEDPASPGTEAPGEPAANSAEELGQPIQSGFLFYRGHYVSPPYFVTMDEDGVKINGICVDLMSGNWSPPPPPPTDPGPFEWTPELLQKKFSASGFEEHLFQRFAYWEARHGFAEACRRAEDYLRQQAQVEKVEREGMSPFSLSYWCKDGSRSAVAFSRALTEREKAERAERDRRACEVEAVGMAQGLRQGYAMFVHVPGALQIVPAGRAAETVRGLLEIAASRKSREEKLRSLLASDYLGLKRSAEAFLEGFHDSPTLRKRLQEIEQERKRVDPFPLKPGGPL